MYSASFSWDHEYFTRERTDLAYLFFTRRACLSQKEVLLHIVVPLITEISFLQLYSKPINGAIGAAMYYVGSPAW